MRLTWAQPEDLVPAEIAALREQGAESGALTEVERRWADAGGETVMQPSGASAEPAPPRLRELARDVLDELAGLRPVAAEEPDDWEQIAAVLPASGGAAGGTHGGSATIGTHPGAVDLATTGRSAATGAGATGGSGVVTVPRDRVAGAWYGRAAGCLLGKPVEKIPREGIEEIARATGNWPVRGYFTAQGLPGDIASRWPWNRRSAPTSLVENIDGMPEDDDLNFPLLALDLLEEHGSALTTEGVAQAWLANLPAGRVFTAERAAYRNLLDARPVPETATHRNPFREWIGALIRADVYGWAHPGDVLGAARLAWVDARLSHVRNGIYGAMWAAALCAASLTEDSETAVLDAADAVVPPRSRLAAAVALGRELGAELATGAKDVPGVLDALHAELGGLHWVHTLNNAALIACAIEGSRGAFGEGIALAVMGGWDTDSAAATVGSVLGAVGGSEAIGEDWTGPLHGRIATSLPGGPERRIEDLVSRTLALPGRMEQ